MSVVVAIKYKNGMAIAADKQSTCGNRKFMTNKVFRAKFSNTAYGGVGQSKMNNILEIAEDLVPAEDILHLTPIDKKYVIKNIVPPLFELFKKYDVLDKQENGNLWINGDVLFVTSKEIYNIGCDGCVMVSNNYGAIGCGDQYVTGYLNSLELDSTKITEKEVINLCRTCIQKACQDDPYIDDNVDIILLHESDDINIG